MEMLMLDGDAGGAGKAKEPGLIARGGGPLCNELRWQMKIELTGAHGEQIACNRREITPKMDAVLCGPTKCGL